MRRTNERTDDGSVEESEPCIETRQHKLLFDVGPDGTLFDNAGKLGIDLSEIDTVILSHEQDGRASGTGQARHGPVHCGQGFFPVWP